MKRIFLTLFLLMAVVASALSAEMSDSLLRNRRWAAPGERQWSMAAVGALLTAEGAIARATGKPYERLPRTSATDADNSVVTDVAQYLPLAFPWVMKGVGVQTRSSWGRMAVSQVVGAVVMAGAVEATKVSVGAMRPDGSDFRSFPSGHAAWAFLGATATAIELQDASPWYAIGAYTFAQGVAIERVLSGRHLPADVVAGAGIGIVAAQVGYWIGDVVFRNRGYNLTDRPFEPERARLSGSVSTGLAWGMGAVSLAEGRLTHLPGLRSRLRVDYNFSPRWWAGVFVGMASTPMQLETAGMNTFIGSQHSLDVGVGAGYGVPLSTRFRLEADLSGGYRFHRRMRTVDDAFTTEGSTPVGRVSVGGVLALTSRLSCRAGVGYELTHYDYRIEPSSNYGSTVRANNSGAMGGLVVNLAAEIALYTP